MARRVVPWVADSPFLAVQIERVLGSRPSESEVLVRSTHLIRGTDRAGSTRTLTMETPTEIVRLAATLIVVAVGVYTYALALIGRHEKGPPDGVDHPLYFIVLVPCLNEAAVIGRTLTSLTSMRGRYHIVVLDDASEMPPRLSSNSSPRGWSR